MRIRIHVIPIVIILLLSSGVILPSDGPSVESITFDGNIKYPDSRLQGLMLTRPSRFLAKGEFHPEVFRDDLATLTTFYRQNGFLQARIVDTVIAIDSSRNQVNIRIGLDEGVRTFVDGVSIYGNQHFPDSILMQHVKMRARDPLLHPMIEDAVVELLHLYAEHGFLDASVTPKVQIDDSAHTALIDFRVYEGVQSRTGDIIIVGAERTQPNVILRELNFQPGDTIKYSKLLDSQRRLYLTGLFESVFVRPAKPDSAQPTERAIRIEVVEKPSSELAFSVGYGTVEKIRGRIELDTDNLAGTARKAGIGIEANFISQDLTLTFSEPWTLGTRWDTDFMLFGRLQQEPAYHAQVVGGKTTVGRRIKEHTTLSVSFRLENTSLSRIDLSVPIEEMDPKIRSLSLSLNHDTRDNLFNPSKGTYIGWTNEVSGGLLRGSNAFARSIVTLKQFYPLGRYAILGSSIEIGWMDSYGDDREIPLSERFYAGGPTSLRGYGYQMVGPRDVNGEPLGGQFKLVFNVLELRHSIYKIFGGAIFVDAGNVWANSEKARLTDLRINTGVGLRVNSPLGIIRLDCGINLDRRADEATLQPLVSMGQAF
jgi:outer membrane protein insertion porin family